MRKAKKQAAKWGGQCIVFIDEIDAVGMRRQSLGSARRGPIHDQPSTAARRADEDGDLVLETAAWRDKLFASRAEPPGWPIPSRSYGSPAPCAT